MPPKSWVKRWNTAYREDNIRLIIYSQNRYFHLHLKLSQVQVFLFPPQPASGLAQLTRALPAVANAPLKDSSGGNRSRYDPREVRDPSKKMACPETGHGHRTDMVGWGFNAGEEGRGKRKKLVASRAYLPPGSINSHGQCPKALYHK
jgi:hypothetical protein